MGVSIAKTMESNLKAYSYNHKCIYMITSFFTSQSADLFIGDSSPVEIQCIDTVV